MKKVTAVIMTQNVIDDDFDESDSKIRVCVPDDFGDGVALVPARQVETGVFVTAAHRGRRWGIVALYSQWIQRDRWGYEHCRGQFYAAYDLADPAAVSAFAELEAMA